MKAAILYMTICGFGLLGTSAVNAQRAGAPASSRSPRVYVFNGNSENNTSVGDSLLVLTRIYPIGTGVPVALSNVRRTMEVRTWKEPKVKVEIYGPAPLDTTKSDVDILENIGIRVYNSDREFSLRSGGTSQTHSMAAISNFNFDFPALELHFPDSAVSLSGTNFEWKTLSKSLESLNTSALEKSSQSLQRSAEELTRQSLFTSKADSIELRKTAAKLRQQAAELRKQAEAARKEASLNRAAAKAEQQKAVAEANARIKEAKARQAEAVKEAEAHRKEAEKMAEAARKAYSKSWSEGNGAVAYSDTNKDNIIIINGDTLNDGHNRSMTIVRGINSRPSGSYRVVVYIPEDHPVKIESSFGNVRIQNKLDSATIVTNNGNLDIQDITAGLLKASFGKIFAGNIGNAQIELANSRIRMNNGEKLHIKSSFSQVDANKINQLQLASNNDDYDLNEVNDLKGSKNFGSLRLDQLTGSFSLNGQNADINIRNLSDHVSSILVNNQFADIRIPTGKLKNYQLQVSGAFNTTYLNEDETDIVNNTGNNPATNASFTDKSNSMTKTVLRGNGKDAHIVIKCNNCTLDLQ